MKQVSLSFIIALFVAASTSAFIVKPSATSLAKQQNVKSLNMIFGGEGEEPQKLTRENEPEDYFQTNLDKQTDEEKLPIALIGLVGISAPFILGLIALYASQ